MPEEIEEKRPVTLGGLAMSAGLITVGSIGLAFQFCEAVGAKTISLANDAATHYRQTKESLTRLAQTKVSHATAFVGVYAIVHTTPLSHQVPPQPQIEMAKPREQEIAYELAKVDDELLKRIRYHTAVPLQNEELDYGDDQAAPDAILGAVGNRDARLYASARNASIDQRIGALQHRRHERRRELMRESYLSIEEIQPMPFNDVVLPDSSLRGYRLAERREQQGSQQYASLARVEADAIQSFNPYAA